VNSGQVKEEQVSYEMDWQIIGHDWAVDLLRQSIVSGRLAHAYLISGPPQTGKTRLARVLAQAVNCTQQDPPCGRCVSCQKIARDAHPDVQVIEGKGAGGSIKIEQIRTLQREAILAPYEGRYRVLILRRADLATLEAANSLLKTLEEPPAHVILVLTAVQVDALPATVVSRCQRIDLRPVSSQVIEGALLEKGLPPAKARLLARLAGGRIGWAFGASEDEAILQRRQQQLDQLVALLSTGRVERLDFAWKASRDPIAAREELELWASWWHDLLLLNGQDPDHVLNTDRLDELQSWVEQSSLAQVWAMLEALQSTLDQLDANVNTRLAMEGLVLKLPHWPADVHTLER
jgi:DNA polymerase-3 subunit delta'